MPTLTSSADRLTLFDMHPEGTEPPIAQRPITLGCLLPAPAKQFVDVERAADIFGVSKQVILEMMHSDILSGYQISPNMRWNIEYSSIVEFCDRLRVEYCIRDRRPKLVPGRRWRDADLLPFPITDTVSIKEVTTGLDVTKEIALNLTEEGAFEAYRIFKGSPWRISKTSLFTFRDRKRAELAAGGFRGRPARNKPRR
jgi:hypothetical protein